MVQLLTRLSLWCGHCRVYTCDWTSQCRLEANYAHQQELDMIPLMMQKDYKPQGWRKSSLKALCLSTYDRHATDVKALLPSGPDHGHTNVVFVLGCGEGRQCGV